MNVSRQARIHQLADFPADGSPRPGQLRASILTDSIVLLEGQLRPWLIVSLHLDQATLGLAQPGLRILVADDVAGVLSGLSKLIRRSSGQFVLPEASSGIDLDDLMAVAGTRSRPED